MPAHDKTDGKKVLLFVSGNVTGNVSTFLYSDFKILFFKSQQGKRRSGKLRRFEQFLILIFVQVA